MPRRRVTQQAMEGAGEGNINKQTPWEAGGVQTGSGSRWLPCMLPAAPGGGPGLRSWEEGPHSSSPACPPAHSQALPGVHNQRWLEVATLVPPVHGAGLGPWGVTRGLRGAARPALPRARQGLRSQC